MGPSFRWDDSRWVGHDQDEVPPLSLKPHYQIKDF